jgi:putative flippase GtrA
MTILLHNQRERARFLRFAVVGIIGAVVDFGVMNLLVNLLSFSLVRAGTISFLAAILSNFIWNRYWTYPDSRSKPISHQLLEFLVVNIAGLLIRLPILAFIDPLIFKLTSMLPIISTSFDTQFISHNLTLAIAVVIVMFWNFFVNRYWTYGDVE